MGHQKQLKELEDKNNSLKNHEGCDFKLGEQFNNLQKDLQAIEVPKDYLEPKSVKERSASEKENDFVEEEPWERKFQTIKPNMELTIRTIWMEDPHSKHLCVR
ncbi:hypothetical protein ACHQM5_021938 [Ranunculus cassubicifolius]